jgi:hypothetical protein
LFFVSTSSGQNHPRVLITSDSIAIINAKVNNPLNDYSHQLYEKLNNFVSSWANHSSPGTSKLFYTRYSDVAFVALLEDDDVMKDKAVQLALQFDTDFTNPTVSEEILFAGFGNVQWNATFFTIATALIYDYCYDRLDANEKAILISNIQLGMNALENDFKNLPGALLYKYYSYHCNYDPGYIIGALAIAGDTPAYTLEDLQNDLDIAKLNMFDEDYGYLRYMFGENGSYLEGCDFFGINFGRIFLLLQALTNYDDGIDYFHLPIVENSLSKVSNWLTSSLFPNRNPIYFVFNGLNDSRVDITFSYVNLLVIAQKYNDGKSRWIFDQAIGTPSQISSIGNVSFPEVFIPSLIIYKDLDYTEPNISEHHTFIDYKRGLLSWRTGWEEDDLMFSIESTPAYHLDDMPIRHLQCDKGNITLTAYGNNFIFDPNGGNDPLHNKTESNNYINIDGVGQSSRNGDDGTFMNSGNLKDYEDYRFYSNMSAKTSTAFDTLFERGYNSIDNI